MPDSEWFATVVRALRWHIHIEPGDPPMGADRETAMDADFDEFDDFVIVECGPDWTRPGYQITITYNDPFGVRSAAP